MAFQNTTATSENNKKGRPKSYSTKIHESFDEINRVFTALSQPVALKDLKSGQELAQILVDITGFPGAFLGYRGAINHLLRYLDSRNSQIDLMDASVLEEFWKHSCNSGCHPSRSLSPSSIIATARLYLLLQLQDILPSHGWHSSDSSLCIDFLNLLLSEGIYPDRAKLQARTALHFIIWLRLKGVSRCEINDHVVNEFAAHSCCCGIHMKSGTPGAQAASRRQFGVYRFLRFLNGNNPVFENGVFIQRRRRSQPSPTVLRYRAWLTDQKGLRPRTVYFYALDVMSWLPGLGEDASTYSATALRDLAATEFARRGPAMQTRFIRSVRSYLQFRAAEGHCSPSLTDALISRPTYRLSKLPCRLEIGAVRQVIDSCDLSTSRGVRDRAILTLLAELGLRATEVWRIRLCDFDWVEAKLCIEGKGGRGAVVPLTQGAGDAVLDYLEKARPASPSDVLFVRMSRPHVPLANAAEISNIARFALSRCGLKGAAHVFRHTLATELLRDGRSLEDVATVLRHRSVGTTMIYAKVNEPMLKRLAEPWMGDRS